MRERAVVISQRVTWIHLIQELERYTAEVVRKPPPNEIAHLPWPAYCFSKAALNAATRILHEAEEGHARSVVGTRDDPMLGRVRQGERSVRIVAVCPGDVATGARAYACAMLLSRRAVSLSTLSHTHPHMLTGMCDVDPSEALSPQQAALDLVWVSLHSRDCPGGQFYRARKEIEW